MGTCKLRAPSKKSLSIAAHWSVSEQVIEITHPFHPLCGRRVEFLHKEEVYGQTLAVVRDSERIFKLPLVWTDAAPVDPFVFQAQGRAFFRTTDLLAMVELVRALVEREV